MQDDLAFVGNDFAGLTTSDGIEIFFALCTNDGYTGFHGFLQVDSMAGMADCSRCLLRA